MFRRAPPLSTCLDLAHRAPLPDVSPEFARRILTSLASGPDATWAWGPADAPQLVGAVVDTCTSAANVADLFPVAGTLDLPPADQDAILAAAEGIAAEGPRDHLEVALLPELSAWREVVEARGYHRAYTLSFMTRDGRAAAAVPPPAPLRWVDTGLALIADHHRLVLAAFAEVPGSMISTFEDFSAAALANRPPARLLLDGERPVAFVRVEAFPEFVELSSLGRDPAWRGRGLGDVVLAEALRIALALDPTTLRLTVAVHNRAALALYERWGFVLGQEIPVWRKPLRT